MTRMSCTRWLLAASVVSTALGCRAPSQWGSDAAASSAEQATEPIVSIPPQPNPTQTTPPQPNDGPSISPVSQPLGQDRGDGYSWQPDPPTTGENRDGGYQPSDEPHLDGGPIGSTPEQAATFLESAQVVAIVGDQYVLAGDIMGQVNQMLKPYEGNASEEELQQQRKLLMQKALSQAVEAKLFYLDFLRTVPKDRLPEIDERLDTQFEEQHLSDMMDRTKTTMPAQLDAMLREHGSSLAKQRQRFGEQLLAREMVRRNVDSSEEVTHDQMLDYYHEHSEEFDLAARARWEQLVVAMPEIPAEQDKQAAFFALGELGNRVLRGAPLSEVAKRGSQGVNAKGGGLHDWTTRGSLRSDVLDQAIFSLPVGVLSQRIEDEQGFHIVRVIEREEAGRIPFLEAQVDIGKKIRNRRRKEKLQTYAERVRDQTRVWTIFDDQPSDHRMTEAGQPLEPRFSR